MRPANPCIVDCQPSCSGRGIQPRQWLDSRTHRISAYPSREGSWSRKNAPQASSSSYFAAFAETETVQPAAKPEPPKSLRVAPPPAVPQAGRDAEGRSLAGRKKPLKINLDLALVKSCFLAASTVSPSSSLAHFFHLLVAVPRPANQDRSQPLKKLKGPVQAVQRGRGGPAAVPRHGP